MSERLPKSERICLERRIEALFAKGRRGCVGQVSYRWLATEAAVSAGCDKGIGCGRGAGESESITVRRGAGKNASGTVSRGVATTEGSEAAKGSVSVMFSVPKKVFRRAWKRNLIKRRMRESYRQRKEALAEAALAAGLHIEIAFVCAPGSTKDATVAKGIRARAKTKGVRVAEIPDFKTIDDAITKILEQIGTRTSAR